MAESRLTGADLGVVAGYFVVIIAVGMFAMYRANRGTISGYFLAGRSMWFLPMGASLFVSNIGTEHFIGLAGSGAAKGISVGAWEINAILFLQLLGWLFIPVYIACGTYTMPEYLSKRFGGQRIRVYFAFLSLVLYIFTKCSTVLLTGAFFIQQSLNWDLYLCIVVLVLITAILTITGGLTAVIYTDTLQALLMVGGSLYLSGAAFYEVGGFSGLLEKYPQAVPRNVSAIVVNQTCHYPDKEAFRMLRDVDDDYMPWLGFLLGQTPGSIWYWCADQVIVQRALAAKSISHAQGATVMTGFLKILPMFVMVMPGMVSRVLYPDEVACSNPDYCFKVCQSKAGCSSIAYPRLALGIMPNGARGLMMAVMIAALMSDLDSIWNSASTLFTIDIWKRFRKHAKVTELMVVGRLFILVMVGLSIAWIPVVKEMQGGQIFIYINEIINYLAPPFAAIFILAVLVPMVNEKGAFWALIVGFVIGASRMIAIFVLKGETYCGKDASADRLPTWISKFHYMYFALSITVLTSIIAITVSYFTGGSEKHFLIRTTYWTRHEKQKPEHIFEAELEFKTPSQENQSSSAVAMADVTVIDGEEGDQALNGEREAGKKVYRDPGLDHPTKNRKKAPVSCGRRVFNYVMGISSVEEDHVQTLAMTAHLEMVAQLHQSKTTRIFLGALLLIVVCVATAMLAFWSVYKFDTAPFYPMGATNETLLPGDPIPPDMGN
ncbi:sodium/glucose cotransporter 4-like [Gigantopelta aegis]|uniref:sodium/glucose cotransporter 4-like n=1 Tax=Gigantopelta aegis TaxID=1735272 RepID=UPI001B88A6D9|nr:sodium/glucose cotransporter 4-like [Gigantopelta aegis]